MVDYLGMLAAPCVLGFLLSSLGDCLVAQKSEEKAYVLNGALEMGTAAAERNDFDNLQQRLESQTNERWDVQRRENGQWDISLTLFEKAEVCEALARQLYRNRSGSLPKYTNLNGEFLEKDVAKTLCQEKRATFVWTGKTKANPEA